MLTLVTLLLVLALAHFCSGSKARALITIVEYGCRGGGGSVNDDDTTPTCRVTLISAPLVSAASSWQKRPLSIESPFSGAGWNYTQAMFWHLGWRGSCSMGTTAPVVLGQNDASLNGIARLFWHKTLTLGNWGYLSWWTKVERSDIISLRYLSFHLRSLTMIAD